jgi:hypothetical protein
LPSSGLLLHRSLGPRAVGADADNRVDERATERAVTQDDVADTALSQSREDARRLPDTETRSKGSEDATSRRATPTRCCSSADRTARQSRTLSKSTIRDDAVEILGRKRELVPEPPQSPVVYPLK